MSTMVRTLLSVFKLRIGFAIMITALAGMAVTPGPVPGGWHIALFALAVLLSSASAGAFNQYIERDLDAAMRRTRSRPFVTGRFQANGYWLALIALLLLLSVAAAGLATNSVAALYVFLGAFTYGIVYTVWLKRRSWINIIIGGLSGSFSVLAGAAAVDPGLSMPPVLLAIVLFLWTPPHFWSLAFIYARDYANAGVPMLPVVTSDHRTAVSIFSHTLVLVPVSLLPFYYGLGWIYLAGALAGGLYFLYTSARFVQSPTIARARINFHASLIQLGLLLSASMIDVAVK